MRRLADVAALAAHHRHPEERATARQPAPLPRRAVRELAFALPTKAHRLLRLLLVASPAAQRLPDGHTLLGRIVALSDAPRQLRGIEVAVAVVDDGGRRAVRELEIGGVVARGRPLRHPLP